MNVKKESGADLAAAYGLHCGTDTKESIELCQQIIDEFHRRDHVNTLTYDQRMELAMEDSDSGQMTFEFMNPTSDSAWNAVYEAGRQAGLKQRLKLTRRSERISEEGAAITVDRIYLTDEDKGELSMGNKSFPSPREQI